MRLRTLNFGGASNRWSVAARPPWTLGLLVTMLLSASLSACTSGTDQPGDSAELRVFAAASLFEAFTEIADAFEQQNPSVTVELNFAGSSSLREQISSGAPADVFASANEQTMDAVIAAGETAGSPKAFATNQLALAVPAANPANVSGLDDLARTELRIGLCALGVPCGDLAQGLLADNNISPQPDTLEPDVRSLLTKLELGELDVGLIYSTDVAASDEVEGVQTNSVAAVSTDYLVARMIRSDNPGVAERFVEFVTSTDGQSILKQFGFGSP